MMNTQSVFGSLSNNELVEATRKLVQRGCVLEAEILAHLGEIDDRKIYLDRAFPSMLAFCVSELGLSEDAAFSRITVARAAKEFPAMLDALRSGTVHLTGLRLLVTHLTNENHLDVLARAAGKSKREIEEIVARLFPKDPVPTIIRKLPAPSSSASGAQPALALAPASTPSPRREERRPVIAPLSEETYKIQFTASRALRDKLRQAQDLLRHRIPHGDPAAIFEMALDMLIGRVMKERFAVGRKARQQSSTTAVERASSRHIPDPTRRYVFERDGGRCTFVDEKGNRCPETGMLEFDHLDGFARTHMHDRDRIFLRCHAHNHHAADQMYGRAFMDRARTRKAPSTRSGTSSQTTLL